MDLSIQINADNQPCLHQQKGVEMLEHDKYYRIYPPYLCVCNHCQKDKNLADAPKKDISLLSSLSDMQQQVGPRLATVQTDRNIKKYGEFLFFCQQLIPPQKVKPVHLDVVDTVFFLNREPQFMIWNRQNSDELNFKFRKSEFAAQQLRLFFTKRRQDYELAVHIKSEREKANQQPNTVYDQNNLKELRDFKQKQAMGLANPELQFVQLHFKQSDGLQIQNYQEFNSILEKRRTDSCWENIIYVQACNYQMNKEELVYRFDFDKEKNKQIFKRALEDVIKYNQYGYNQSKQYKEEQEYVKHLKEHNFKVYLAYIAYKLHHFIELYKKLKLKKVHLYFVRDSLDNVQLVNVKQIAFLNVHSIEFQDYFQHYVDNYTEEEQIQLINELEEVNAQKKIETSKKLQKYDKKIDPKTASNKFKQMNNFLSKNTEQFFGQIQKVDEMLTKLDKIEQKVITSKTFKQINEKATSDFYDLIKLDQQKDMLRFRDKGQLCNNFVQEKKRFNRDLQYFEYKNEKQLKYLKKHAMVDVKGIDKDKIKQQGQQYNYQNQNNDDSLEEMNTVTITQQLLKEHKNNLNGMFNDDVLRSQQLQQSQYIPLKKQKERYYSQQGNTTQKQIQMLYANNKNKEQEDNVQDLQNQQQYYQDNYGIQEVDEGDQFQNLDQINKSNYYNISQNNSQKTLFRKHSSQLQQKQSQQSSQQQFQNSQQQQMSQMQNMQITQSQQDFNFNQNYSNQMFNNQQQSQNNLKSSQQFMSSSNFAKNLSTPASKEIKGKKIRYLMSKHSSIIKFSKLPQYKLKQQGEEYENALPILLNMNN